MTTYGDDFTMKVLLSALALKREEVPALHLAYYHGPFELLDKKQPILCENTYSELNVMLS